MTPGVVRLTIGFGLLPFLPGLFWIVGMATEHFLSVPDEMAMAIAYEACALVTVATWVGVWRRGVAWTPGRRRGTIALAVALLAVPWSTFLPDGPEPWETARDTLPLLMLAAWFFSTALLWRTDAPAGYVDSSAAALDRAIGCPGCGYSLRGLREVRCPECGWHSTVDVLMAHGLAAIDED